MGRSFVDLVEALEKRPKLESPKDLVPNGIIDVGSDTSSKFDGLWAPKRGPSCSNELGEFGSNLHVLIFWSTTCPKNRVRGKRSQPDPRWARIRCQTSIFAWAKRHQLGNITRS